MTDEKGHTIIKINEADLVALLGDNGEHWVQGSWSENDSMCLHGAIRRCSPVPGDAFLIEQVAYQKGWGVSWNDADDTTWTDIRARLARVEVTDVDLAGTFGPQWEHIVALVRRAALLNSEEAEMVVIAWSVASDTAAWDAAWDAYAAWDDAYAAGAAGAAGNAAGFAAGETAGDAEGEAARAAAWALAARHLVGNHGFSQKHYDLLTGPWATVIGPVHPDDEARRG